jgi:hypothetical protein
MNKKISQIAVLITWFIASAHAQTATNDQIASQFMPPMFAAFAADNPYLAHRDTTWRVLPVDLDHTGKLDYLAIGYGNGHIGFLRVVRKVGTPVLAADSSSEVECDSGPNVKAIDLDGDGKPELSIDCRIGHAGNRFFSLFRWSKDGLTTLNPLEESDSSEWRPIQDANFVDTDGDGIMEVLEPSAPTSVDENGFVSQQWDTYRLVDGKLTKFVNGAISHYEIFLRHKGAPVTTVDKFAATPGAYTLTILNGQRGQNLVSSGVVTLNGVSMAQPSSFSKAAVCVNTNVTLTDRNTLSVELRSAPESFIEVLLTPKH